MQKINASWEEQFYARLSDRWMGWHNPDAQAAGLGHGVVDDLPPQSS